jgi:hypothetical protein
MTNCRDIKYCVIELLNKNNVNIEGKEKQRVVFILVRYVEHLIFNMVAVACLVCLTIGIKKLVKDHVQHLEGYITKRCRLSVRTGKNRMKGGSAFNTAAFYGVPEPRYSAANAGGDVMNIDWNNNIARPMLASTMTGGKGKASCNKLHKIISKEIYNVFKFFKIKSNKEARDEFIKLFNKFMAELFAKLSAIKVINVKNLSDILKKSKLSDSLHEWKK